MNEWAEVYSKWAVFAMSLKAKCLLSPKQANLILANLHDGHGQIASRFTKHKKAAFDDITEIKDCFLCNI